jgi:anti-sigma B factor antagonist
MSDLDFPVPRADYRAGAGELAAPRLEVVPHTARIALVNVTGEQDLATKDAVLDAFARAAAHPCIVVDLSRCTFVDSTFIGVLVALHGTDICAVRLVVPEAQRIVRRTFQMVQMDQLFPLHDSLEEALLAAAADDTAPRASSEVSA